MFPVTRKEPEDFRFAQLYKEYKVQKADFLVEFANFLEEQYELFNPTFLWGRSRYSTSALLPPSVASTPKEDKDKPSGTHLSSQVQQLSRWRTSAFSPIDSDSPSRSGRNWASGSRTGRTLT